MGLCGSMESHPAWSVERGQAAWSVHLKQMARSPRGSLAQQGQCRLPADSGLPPLLTSGGGHQIPIILVFCICERGALPYGSEDIRRGRCKSSRCGPTVGS
jgi:hypothetical protein